MFCGNCGRQIADNAKFCGGCGTRMLPPEQPEWYAKIREQCTTPIAMGELFNHPLEWRYRSCI